jgi:hypothetical protein
MALCLAAATDGNLPFQSMPSSMPAPRAAQIKRSKIFDILRPTSEAAIERQELG